MSPCYSNDDGSMFVCSPTTVLIRRIQHCPTENAPRRMVGSFAVWYGTDWTCLGCGDRWMDGERGERPFARGWRKESIARAERLYAHALSGAAAKSAQTRLLKDSFA